MSPTIPIPSSFHNKELINISCDVGSKTSETELPVEPKSQSSNTDINCDTQNNNQKISEIPTSISSSSNVSSGRNIFKVKKTETKISDMSSDSLVWLSHRLGPVLTARYLSRNLLKMLTLCYVGKENMIFSQIDENEFFGDHFELISIASSHVVGDKSASKVLDCLTSIAGL